MFWIKKNLLLFAMLVNMPCLDAGKTKKKRDRRKLVQQVTVEECNLVEILKEHLKIIDDCFACPINKMKPDKTDLQENFRLELETIRTIIVAQQRTIDNLENTFYEKTNKLPDYPVLRSGIRSLKKKHINTILRSEKFLMLAQRLLDMSSDSDFSDISMELATHISSLMSYENGFIALEKTPLQMLHFGNLLHTFVHQLIKLEVSKENINLLKQTLFCAYSAPHYKYLKKLKNAFHSKNIDTLITLLQEGALPSWHVTINANTALTIALNDQAYNLAKLLLYCPTTDINAQTKYGDSPLIIAAKKRNAQLAQLLLEEVDYRFNDQTQDLIEFQAVNLNIQNKQGETALIAAIQSSASNVAELILSYKPNTSLCDHNGYNAYYWAYHRKNEKIMNLLSS